MAGILYIVATPIGNLEDITFRAINILKNVDFIIAEDTRHTLKLLNHLNISKPLISYYKQNEISKSEKIIEKIKKGQNVALVSDAGTPGISDPGEVIIKKAIEMEITVVPIPGASACINALVASGLNTSHFYFEGFLPVNKKDKNERLENIKSIKATLIIYEAPHKLLNTLTDIQSILGNRNIVLAHELTKIHENFVRGPINEIINNLSENIKGEYIILVEGTLYSEKELEIQNLNKLSLIEHYKYYEKLNIEKNEIIKKIAKDRNVPKNEIYKHFIGNK